MTTGIRYIHTKIVTQQPWTYIYVLTKAYFCFTSLFPSSYTVKKGKLLSATTVNTRERPGKTKISFGEDVETRAWYLSLD